MRWLVLSSGASSRRREGKVIASNKVTYGFGFNAAGDGLLIREEHMSVVRRVVRMVRGEGATL